MEKDLFLVIDMQNAYDENGEWYCPSIKQAKENIVKVLENVNGKVDIAFTKFLASKSPEGIWKNYNEINKAVNEDVNANLMIDLFNKYDYPVYEKSTYSSLKNDQVKKLAKEARRVVVSGVVAECCVLSTVMELIDEGVYVIYLKDAVAGVSQETEKAVECILDGLSYVHLSVMTTDEYLQGINQE